MMWKTFLEIIIFVTSFKIGNHFHVADFKNAISNAKNEIKQQQNKVNWCHGSQLGSIFFIRPFEKRTYYAMAMSVRLSVRPSVRPSFPDFFSTCFEISISNLVHAFSRWHDMSSLSFITIGSLWLSLQPKVGQTQFLQSWPYKSR